MTYRSKVDAGLAVGVGFGVAMAWAGAFLVLLQGHWVGWIALVVVVGVVLVIFPVTYRIDVRERSLKVRSGVIRWRIPLDSIEAVHPTRNPLSSPAWSLDRLHVSYRGGDGGIRFVLISPSRRREFLRELADNVGGLELKDGVIERTEARPTFTG